MFSKTPPLTWVNFWAGIAMVRRTRMRGRTAGGEYPGAAENSRNMGLTPRVDSIDMMQKPCGIFPATFSFFFPPFRPTKNQPTFTNKLLRRREYILVIVRMYVTFLTHNLTWNQVKEGKTSSYVTSITVFMLSGCLSRADLPPPTTLAAPPPAPSSRLLAY